MHCEGAHTPRRSPLPIYYCRNTENLTSHSCKFGLKKQEMQSIYIRRMGNVVWGSLSSAELQALQRLQNRALSIIESARFKDPWPKKWLNVESLIRFDRSVLVYKIFNKLCPESLWNMFQL